MKKDWKFIYSKHYRDMAEGHIFIENKENACTIGLLPSFSMKQSELDEIAEFMCEAVNEKLVSTDKKTVRTDLW